MKGLPRLVDRIGGIYARATTETGGSQPQQVGRLGLIQLERWRQAGYLYIAEISVAV